MDMLDSGERLAGDELDEAAGGGERVLKTYVLLPLNGWTRP